MKKIKSIIFLILTIMIFMNTINTIGKDIAEENLKDIIESIKIDDEKIINKASPKQKEIKTNGFYFYLDKERKVIKDLREYMQCEKYAIGINRAKATLTVYGFNSEEKEYNIPIVSFPCTLNSWKTKLGTYKVSEVINGWHPMFGGHYSQYCLRFNGHIMMHSVLYKKPDSYSLEAHTYNGIMGTAVSSGCVRLRTGDAYWLVNNLKEGTPVIVYENEETNSPLGRPKFDLIDNDLCFDPTDPKVIKDLQKVKGEILKNE